MAVFTKDSELKNYKLPQDKAREWLKNQSTPYLYIYATKTKNGVTKTFIYKYADPTDPARKLNQIIIGKYPSISLVRRVSLRLHS